MKNKIFEWYVKAAVVFVICALIFDIIMLVTQLSEVI
jgi:hypothetical protein